MGGETNREPHVWLVTDCDECPFENDGDCVMDTRGRSTRERGKAPRPGWCSLDQVPEVIVRIRGAR